MHVSHPCLLACCRMVLCKKNMPNPYIREEELSGLADGRAVCVGGHQLRALHPKANKAEKVKNSKGGDKMWTEISELGELIRAGNTSWEDLGLDDIDVRLKWAGLFHRRKRAPGKFMMRLKVRNAHPGDTPKSHHCVGMTQGRGP